MKSEGTGEGDREREDGIEENAEGRVRPGEAGVDLHNKAVHQTKGDKGFIFYTFSMNSRHKTTRTTFTCYKAQDL